MKTNTDKQRAARARQLLREAGRLVEELVDGGAAELHRALCDIRAAAETMDDMDFDGCGKFVAARRLFDDEWS